MMTWCEIKGCPLTPGSELQPPDNSEVRHPDYFVHHPPWQVHCYWPGKVPLSDPKGQWGTLGYLVLHSQVPKWRVFTTCCQIGDTRKLIRSRQGQDQLKVTTLYSITLTIIESQTNQNLYLDLVWFGLGFCASCKCRNSLAFKELALQSGRSITCRRLVTLWCDRSSATRPLVSIYLGNLGDILLQAGIRPNAEAMVVFTCCNFNFNPKETQSWRYILCWAAISFQHLPINAGSISRHWVVSFLMSS